MIYKIYRTTERVCLEVRLPEAILEFKNDPLPGSLALGVLLQLTSAKGGVYFPYPESETPCSSLWWTEYGKGSELASLRV